MTKKDFIHKLKDNGYMCVRQRGSHGIYCDGIHTVAVPMSKFKSVIGLRLIKELNLV